MSETRFLRAFAVTALACLGALAALCGLVDPFDQYGGHGLTPATRDPRPATRASRVAKAAGLAARSDYGGLVLGSSRVLTLSPAALERAAGTPFYNAGVSFGRAEDYLAIARRFVAVHGRAPREVVVGLDVDALQDGPPIDPELVRTAALRAEVPECLALADRLRPIRDLVSWSQATSAARLLFGRARGRSAPDRDEYFAADGSIVYALRDRQIGAGSYDRAAAYAYDRGVYTRLHRASGGVSPMRERAWRGLCRLCATHGAAPTVYLTPVHPRLLEDLRAGSSFEERRAEVARLVRETLPPGGTVRDLTEVASFGGDPDGFYDGVHLHAANAGLVIDALFRGREGARDAVQ